MRHLVALLLIGAAPAAVPPRQYTLHAGHLTVRFLDYGGTITAIEAPDRAGHVANVVLGYGSAAEYPAMNMKNGFGATIGRYAGRIAGATVTVDGREWPLTANDGANALHGGAPGWQARTFTVRQTAPDAATLTYLSRDGDQGFPGAVTLTVRYRVLPNDSLRIDYEARTSKATYLNLTNHSYFNLGGQGSGSIAGHHLMIAAARWVEQHGDGIPTGRLPPVAGTPYDFRRPHAIGERIEQTAAASGPHAGYNEAWLFG